MSFQCVTLESSLYYLVEIKSKCLGTGVLDGNECYLDNLHLATR
ncbi:MAG: hypothetical protein ACR5LA_10485 [Wolbachia sp.]